jgi:hypothetical protein
MVGPEGCILLGVDRLTDAAERFWVVWLVPPG